MTIAIGEAMIELKGTERHFHYWRGQSAARHLADNADWLTSVMPGAGLIHVSGVTLPSFDDEAGLWGDRTPDDTRDWLSHAGVTEIAVKNGAGPIIATSDGGQIAVGAGDRPSRGAHPKEYGPEACGREALGEGLFGFYVLLSCLISRRIAR